ncbi:MAG: type III-B CRISPR module-associated protein Cmr3 [Gammaproteobacteria bacterium]
MPKRTWRFNAADSLFFGAGKPMNAGESSWTDSQFPPTGLTLQGAIRTAVLYSTEADIDAFTHGKPCFPDGGSLKDEIGCVKTLGKLELTGPFLHDNGELLFPAPLDLMSNIQGQHVLLKPADDPTACDLGNIRLPAVDGTGYKVSENCYVNHRDMAKLLNGETDGIKPIPLFADNPKDKALADKEPKIGLARDNKTRNYEPGMLFAIAPVRPRKDVSLHLRVQGIAPEHLPQSTFLQRLGGEGKLAAISVREEDIKMPLPPRITPDGETVRFKLVFTQPALMPLYGWLPEGFALSKEKDRWIGQLNTCEVAIISACIGKPLKLGGWDLKTGSSKTHQAYIPAGSVYFCEAQAKDREAILQLHDTKLGKNRKYGFGHVLVGGW